MFTGIIQGLGVVHKVVRKGGGKRITIVANGAVTDVQVGESLSVNGTCLTVLSVQTNYNSPKQKSRRPSTSRKLTSPSKSRVENTIDETRHRLVVEAGEETLKKTTLGTLRSGERVNLEQSLRIGDRLGGHFVQGHVDGRGKVRKKIKLTASILLEIDIPRNLSSFLVEKGSIGVDGVSLTIVSVEDNRFSVSILPYTIQETTLGVRNVGDEVNIEVDIIAKHIHNTVKTNFKNKLDARL